jgi:group I intron endonuclease
MKITGIYKIESKLKPERIYIGSAVHMMNRWNVHLSLLKDNKHFNTKLQRHYNKYGKNDLLFSIIIGCDKENLIANEQFFIDSYNPWFNICKKAESRLGTKGQIPWNKGIRTGIKIPTAFKKGNIPWNKDKKGLYTHSKEANEKRSISMKGKNIWRKGMRDSDESRLKKSEGQKKRRLKEMNIILN